MVKRKIVVSSNCQTGGLAVALAAMLPFDQVVPCPCVGADASEQVLGNQLQDADAWVTAAEHDSPVDALLPQRDVEVVRVPRIFFRAFQPDVIFISGPDGEWLESPVARTHSAIVVWGWRHGLDARQIVALFNPPVFDGLGYTAEWHPEVERLRAAVEPTDVDFPSFFLPLRRRVPFMFSVNHPRLEVMVQIARQAARTLGADNDRVAYPWESVLPDALLASGPVWPVYPAIAATLGGRGGFVWRRWNDARILGLDDFVEASLGRYARYSPDDVIAPPLDDPRFDQVLGAALAGV
jgi:hypothetical protein